MKIRPTVQSNTLRIFQKYNDKLQIPGVQYLACSQTDPFCTFSLNVYVCHNLKAHKIFQPIKHKQYIGYKHKDNTYFTIFAKPPT